MRKIYPAQKIHDLTRVNNEDMLILGRLEVRVDDMRKRVDAYDALLTLAYLLRDTLRLKGDDELIPEIWLRERILRTIRVAEGAK